MQDHPSPTGPPDLLDARVLRAALPDPAAAGPVSLEVAWSVDSTNAELWRRPPGQGWEILLAEQQTAGRGRLGRSWVSPLSSQVCVSVRGRFAGGLAQLEGLSLVVGVALSEALRGLGFPQVGLKWPNDVLAGRQVRVLAGRRVIEGQALGLAADGGLRVATDAGEQVFHGGEVSVRAR